MKRKVWRAVSLAFVAILLMAMSAAAQSAEPVTVRTTARVPVVVELDAATAGVSGPVTVTLLVTQEVVMVEEEVISRTVTTQVEAPEGMPVAVEVAAAELAAEVVMLAPLADPMPASEPEVVGPTANRGANLRDGPGTNYPVVGGVAEGDPLEIVGQNAAGDWYNLAGGQWIAAFLVDNAPTGLPVVAAPPVPTPVPQTGGSAKLVGTTVLSAEAAAHFDLAMTYMGQKDYARALQELNQVIALVPDFALAYFARGIIYQVQDNCGAAIPDFTKAINLGLGEADVYEARAVCYLDTGNYGLAIPDLEKLLALNPNHPQRAQIEALLQQLRQLQ